MYQTQTIALKDFPFIQRIVKAVTDSRKQKASVTFCEKVTLSGTYWDEGSISKYTLVTWDTTNPNQMSEMPLPSYAPPQFGGPKQDPVVNIEMNQAVVETGYFCGKVATPRIYIRSYLPNV